MRGAPQEQQGPSDSLAVADQSEDLDQWERRASLGRRVRLDQQVRTEIRDLSGCLGLPALQDLQETMGIRESREHLGRKAAKEIKGKQDPQAPLALRGSLVSQDFQVWMDWWVPGASRACTVPKETRDPAASRALKDR